MSKNKLSEIIIEKYGENLYKKSLNFPKNKIKIISLKKNNNFEMVKYLML